MGLTEDRAGRPWDGQLDHALLTQEEEVELRRRYQRATTAGDVAEASRTEAAFIAQNMKLVMYGARRRHWYSGPLVDLDDAFQEGSWAAVLAFRRWDPERGTKFSAYAVPSIEGAAQEYIDRFRSAVTVPGSRARAMGRIRRAQAEVREREGTEPTVEQVAELIGESPRRVRATLDSGVFHALVSLDAPVRDTDDVTLAALLPAPADGSPGWGMTEGMNVEALHAAIDRLGPQERRVVQLRFGLVDGEPRLLEWIGRRLGLTRQRIQQIEKSALRKLREDGDLARDLDRAA